MKTPLIVAAVAVAALVAACASPHETEKKNSFWGLYESTFKSAKYVDLTHAFEPVQAVWPGFGQAKFKPAIAGADLWRLCQEGR